MPGRMSTGQDKHQVGQLTWRSMGQTHGRPPVVATPHSTTPTTEQSLSPGTVGHAASVGGDGGAARSWGGSPPKMSAQLQADKQFSRAPGMMLMRMVSRLMIN